MPAAQSAEILRIHIPESDRLKGKPLYEAIIAKCRELQIAGATVFRGLEGFGEDAEMQKHPVVITIVDTAGNIARLIPVVSEMIDTGFMVSSAVEMVRVQKAQL